MDAVVACRIIAALGMVLCVLVWKKEGYYVPHFRLFTRTDADRPSYSRSVHDAAREWEQDVHWAAANWNGYKERNWWEVKHPTRIKS